MAKKKSILSFPTLSYLTSDLIVGNVLFVLFLGFLAVIYIANVHQAEGNVREIQVLQKELRELRWYYRSLQAENMYNSKQSELMEKVKAKGLRPITDQPKIIRIEE